MALESRVAYELETVGADGGVTPVAAGEAAEATIAGPTATRGEYTFVVPPQVVPAGSALRLSLRFSGVYTSTMRLLYGGPFADGGITLTTGAVVG
ncbi:hypothetical protein BH18ACT4_BH18ACT4_00380 [soil metagenome]